MKLSDFVVTESIVPEMQSADRSGVIRELIEAMAEGGAVQKDDVDVLVRAVIQRENQGSTGFGKGVAVPHVKHEAVKTMVGDHTRLITCLARWNRADATKVVPQALKAGVGLYGFTKPRTAGGLVPLEPILSRPVTELRGDDRNIAVLARAYHGAPVDAVWKDGAFAAASGQHTVGDRSQGN